MNENYKLAIGFVLSYLILYLLSFFNTFPDFSSILYYLGPIPMYFIAYYTFSYLQKETNFKFNEPYVGFLLLVILWLGFWMAFRVYYGNIASLNGMNYATFYVNANLDIFRSLMSMPYIYMALSFFFGWIMFSYSAYNDDAKMSSDKKKR